MPYELKHCPMCGPGNSVVELFVNQYGKNQIGCGACGLTSGFRVDNDIEKLVTHWNTRKCECLSGETATLPSEKGGIVSDGTKCECHE